MIFWVFFLLLLSTGVKRHAQRGYNRFDHDTCAHGVCLGVHRNRQKREDEGGITVCLVRAFNFFF